MKLGATSLIIPSYITDTLRPIIKYFVKRLSFSERGYGGFRNCLIKRLNVQCLLHRGRGLP